MREVGIFEAKTHLTRLCEEVERGDGPILISKRGRPMVILQRAEGERMNGREDIQSAWVKWMKEHGEEKAEYPSVEELRGANKGNPLEE